MVQGMWWKLYLIFILTCVVYVDTVLTLFYCIRMILDDLSLSITTIRMQELLNFFRPDWNLLITLIITSSTQKYRFFLMKFSLHTFESFKFGSLRILYIYPHWQVDHDRTPWASNSSVYIGKCFILSVLEHEQITWIMALQKWPPIGVKELLSIM